MADLSPGFLFPIAVRRFSQFFDSFQSGYQRRRLHLLRLRTRLWIHTFLTAAVFRCFQSSGKPILQALTIAGARYYCFFEFLYTRAIETLELELRRRCSFTC
jgi:hypothetical protein